MRRDCFSSSRVGVKPRLRPVDIDVRIAKPPDGYQRDAFSSDEINELLAKLRDTLKAAGRDLFKIGLNSQFNSELRIGGR